MALLEADPLPVAKLKLSRPMVRLDERRGANMSGESTPGVLMLRCAALSHHAVRIAARQAGLAPGIELAESRREFLDDLHRGRIDLIIAGLEGLPDLDLRGIFERARCARPPIPVIVAGGRMGEGEALRVVREGATEILQSGQMERLPSAMARALKLRQSAVLQAHAQREMERSAVLLRENQKLITIGRLAASIAHEINNPLESVTNLLYLLGEEHSLTPAAQNYLALAQRELQRVAHISRQTLNFSRETTGPVRTRIDELLEEVLSLYSRRIMEKNLRVERQYDCPEEAVVYPGEMRQVLSNLVTNALEASSPGGRLRLRIRCMRSWSDPGVRGIRISVGDNGSGITPEVQRRLGEPFFTTKGQRGTGLGLWVTRSIVQRYGGEIQLRSSISPTRHGTVFSIFLPINLRPRVVDRTPPDPSDGDGGGLGTSFPASRAGSALRFSSGAPRRRMSGA